MYSSPTGEPNWLPRPADFKAEAECNKNEKLVAAFKKNPEMSLPPRKRLRSYDESRGMGIIQAYQAPKPVKRQRLSPQVIELRPKSTESLNNVYYTKGILEYKFTPGTNETQYEVNFENYAESEKKWLKAKCVGDKHIEAFWRPLEDSLCGGDMEVSNTCMPVMSAVLASKTRVIMDHRLSVRLEQRKAARAAMLQRSDDVEEEGDREAQVDTLRT